MAAVTGGAGAGASASESGWSAGSSEIGRPAESPWERDLPFFKDLLEHSPTVDGLVATAKTGGLIERFLNDYAASRNRVRESKQPVVNYAYKVQSVTTTYETYKTYEGAFTYSPFFTINREVVKAILLFWPVFSERVLRPYDSSTLSKLFVLSAETIEDAKRKFEFTGPQQALIDEGRALYSEAEAFIHADGDATPAVQYEMYAHPFALYPFRVRVYDFFENIKKAFEKDSHYPRIARIWTNRDSTGRNPLFVVGSGSLGSRTTPTRISLRIIGITEPTRGGHRRSTRRNKRRRGATRRRCLRKHVGA